MKRYGWAIAIVLLVVVLLVTGIGAAMYLAFRPAPARVADGSTLFLRVGGEYTEAPPPDDPFMEVFGNLPASLSDLRSALTKAARDDRIDRVVVRIDPLGVGLGKTQEMRDMVQRFRDKSGGKPISAYMQAGANKEYYLASAFDEIWFAPEGFLMFTGLNFEVMFLKDTLGKVGVEAEFAAIGKYKNAPDTLTNSEMSEAHREVMNSLADEFWDQIIAGVAEGRGVSPDTVRSWLDDPPMTAKEALQRGMINELVYRDQLVDRFKKEGDEDWKTVSLGSYKKVSGRSLGFKTQGTVAVVYAEGNVVTGKSSPGNMGSATITKAIRDARKNDKVEALILRVDSPGGSGLASDLIWREIVLTTEEMPVIVSMSDLAASGGYYVSMAADHITAQPATLTGSIGVFAGKLNLAGLYDKVGVRFETVSRGPYAGLFSSTKPFDEEGRDKLEGFVEGFYETFVRHVAEGRGMEWDAAHAVAQGRVWTGRQGKDKGLVDALGGMDAAIAEAKKRLDLTDDDLVELIQYPRQKTFIEELTSRGAGDVRSDLGAEAAELIDPELARLLRTREVFDGSPTAMLPFSIRIR